ncbi:MAG TPA: hypothetical protein VJ521_05600 [Acidobacteriota bacterium]|nr:hypothetical protein [Acidobacteriota bacterium]
MKQRVLTFVLITFCFAGFSTQAFSYTLIYKNGKRIDGTWVSEDLRTIRFKDQRGAVFTVNKSQLDLRAMAINARYAEKPATLKAEPAPVLQPSAPQKQSTSKASSKSSTSMEDTGISRTNPGLTPEIARTRPETAKPHQKWSIFTNVYNGYDTNIDHDEESIDSMGFVYGGGVKYRNKVKDPTFWISYEIANHHYTNTDKWDRVSQSILTVYTIDLSKRFAVQNQGEISFKGSSEDRELSDNFVFRPMLVYQMTDSDRLNFFVAQRFKRFDDVQNSRDANNRFLGFGYEREFGKHEIEFVYKYEKNNAETDRSDYVRSTYTAEYKMPFPYNSVAAFEFKVRPTRFFHRFAEIEVNNGRDLEVPRRDIKYNISVELAIPLGNHLELMPAYEFEWRTSNDEEEFYKAHLPAITLNYVW